MHCEAGVGGLLWTVATGGTTPVTMKRPGKRQTQESQASTSRKKGKPSKSEKKSLTGGILANITKYTSFVVNIRPPIWDDKSKPSQFWIGKIPSFERAQQIADAIYFYTGKRPFHFKDVVNLYPSITCIGIVPGTPEELSTQKMFRTYTSAIAKGVEFKLQREDFIAQVKGIIEMDTFPFLAPPEDAPEHDEHDEEEDIPDMEDDMNAAMAIRMSSNALPAAAGVNTVPGSDRMQAFVPIVDFQHGELASGLRGVGHYFDSSTSQFSDPMLLPESTDDNPTSPDKESDQEWTVDGCTD